MGRRSQRVEEMRGRYRVPDAQRRCVLELLAHEDAACEMSARVRLAAHLSTRARQIAAQHYCVIRPPGG